MLFFGLLAMAVAAIAVTVVLHIGQHAQPMPNSYPQKDYGGDEERQNYNERNLKSK